MVRIIIFLILGSIACRMISGRWPWELWRVSERSQDEAQARALLGVERSATRSAILQAHKALIVRVHPDREGGTAEQVHAANRARDLLLARLQRIEPEKK